MARFLVDANVLCEPTKTAPESRVVGWLVRNERLVAIDAVILGEIRYGILLLAEGRRRRGLEAWFSQVVQRVECLPWDAATGLCWAELLARVRGLGRTMTVKDSLIAATALRNGLTLATRNERDFAPGGVDIVNPFG